MGCLNAVPTVERFRWQEPIDRVMLFAASALVTKPILRNSPFRFEILTALWCRYKTEDFDREALADKDLIDWFTLGLFGRHTTVYEVETWTTGCQKWLGDEETEPEPLEAHTRHHTRDLTQH
jgi:hypothetical protein